MANPKKPPKAYLKFSGIAFQMIAIIGIGTYFGVHLDEKYAKETPFYSLIFSLASVGISLVVTILQIIHKPNDRNES